MSAEIHATAWDAYCADCNEGTGPHADFTEADEWAEKHNIEHHSEES